MSSVRARHRDARDRRRTDAGASQRRPVYATDLFRGRSGGRRADRNRFANAGRDSDHRQAVARSGWQVWPLDFKAFDDLYDVRVILETAAIRKLCEMTPQPLLANLRDVWLAPRAQWLTDSRLVADLDEAFHGTIVTATGNA